MNLSIFCSHDRGNMKVPFNIGEHTYASNGHIIVRIDKKEMFAELKDASFEKNVLHLPWDKVSDMASPHPVPAFDTGGLPDCRKCDGAGVLEVCPECDGSKTICFANDHNDYELTCKTCNGEGSVPAELGRACPYCLGSGRNLHDAGLVVGNRKISLRNLMLLHKLVGVQLNAEGESTEVIPFTFLGGAGMVMPMRP